MKIHWFVALGLLAAISIAAFALVGCGGTTDSDIPATGTTPAAQGPKEDVVYTVTADELENPENKAVYVCPMQEHKDQVSLDPEARCKICKMKLVPMEEAENAAGGETEEDHSGHDH